MKTVGFMLLSAAGLAAAVAPSAAAGIDGSDAPLPEPTPPHPPSIVNETTCNEHQRLKIEEALRQCRQGAAKAAVKVLESSPAELARYFGEVTPSDQEVLSAEYRAIESICAVEDGSLFTIGCRDLDACRSADYVAEGDAFDICPQALEDPAVARRDCTGFKALTSLATRWALRNWAGIGRRAEPNYLADFALVYLPSMLRSSLSITWFLMEALDECVDPFEAFKLLPGDFLPGALIPTGLLPTGLLPTGLLPTGLLPTDLIPDALPTGWWKRGPQPADDAQGWRTVFVRQSRPTSTALPEPRTTAGPQRWEFVPQSQPTTTSLGH